MLNKDEYPTWKVKMMMFLGATNYDYLDIIHDGPLIARKLIPSTIVEEVNQLEHYALKDMSDWTKEEKTEDLKDAKVSNILHNAFDVVISTRVITCKTVKSGFVCRRGGGGGGVEYKLYCFIEFVRFI